MKLVKYTTTMALMAGAVSASGQTATDTTGNKSVSLNEVVVSANKVPELKKNIAQEVLVIGPKQIQTAQAQTTADLLTNTSTIFVQKSQMGGGSPVLRGFEANRILMVIDGVRMNNLIYRGGHLQNIITVDNNSLDHLEVLFGPSSTVYGSDALGGVVHFFTPKPKFGDSCMNKNVNAMVRYGSVDNEMTGHADFNLGGKKFASYTSFTYSSFDNLKGGKNQNFFFDTSYGERPYYVDRINGTDSMVSNPDRYEQVPSGYTQYDIIQKFAYKQNDRITHGLNLQFSNTSDIPRYDRLTDVSGKNLRYGQWYYGPQQRFMAAYDMNYNNESSFFQSRHLGINYQNIEESRHTRSFGKNDLTHRTEYVNIGGLNLDVQRTTNHHNLRLGIDAQYNSLKSRANVENIANGAEKTLDTRYPDGKNNMANYAAYGTHTWTINDRFVMVDGLRLGYTSLHSEFVNKTFFPFPYNEVTQNNFVYSGSLGIIYNHCDDLKISLLESSGFRVPNVDDLSKVFESSKGNVIVPNPNLRPEKTLCTELGISKVFDKEVILENAFYYTHIFDAIVTDKYTFENKDSVMYDGAMSRVMANQNKRDAYIAGFSSNLRAMITGDFSLSAGVTYTYGRIVTDTTDAPLDHIPPVVARLAVNYAKNKFSSGLFFNFQGGKKLKDYYLNGEDNEQYATKDGMPAWFIANFRISYQVHKYIALQAGVDNILDTQYRVFASGINAPGRNIFGAIRFNY